jgi:hypothetical protein
MTPRTRDLARVAVGLVASATVIATAATPGVADAAVSGRDKARATPTYRAASGPRCDLRSKDGATTKTEWLSCLSVKAQLDTAPRVGGTTTLRLTVRAAVDIGATTVVATLPEGLRWVTAPAGFTIRTITGVTPETAGSGSAATAVRRLGAGDEIAVTGTVRAITAGPAQIRVRATAPYAGGVQAGADDVFVTIGGGNTAARFGRAKTAADETVAAVPTRLRTARPANLRARSVGVAGLKRPTTRVGAPCDTSVTGNWSYQDNTGAWRNAMNVQVQVWDADSLSADDLLASGVTDGSGNYNLCFDSDSEGFGEGGTADVYVKFITENSLWKVQRSGSALSFRTGTTDNVTPGTALNEGSLTSGDATLQRGLHAFDEANDAWLWVPKPTNLCFDQNDTSCRQLVINWAPDSIDGTYYSRNSKDVHLAADDPNAQIVVVHEIGHAIMDDVYNNAFPVASNCNPHSIQGTSSAGCAWTEGWAEWFPSTVYNDPFFRWASGASLDLENASWGNGWGEGDTTEGRIAGALIDITDSANEATWDRYSEGSINLWSTFTHHVSNTLSEFWSQRGGDGFDVADSGASASLYQNTVDYSFRDPMGNYVSLSRPSPVPSHNFSYNTTTSYWSAVAVRTPVGTDADLSVFDDRALGSNIGGSAYGGSAIDFVAVDSNRRSYGDYYPQVRRYSGTGRYRVELAQGSSILSAGSQTVSMGLREIVAVRDVYLTAGTPVTIRATPTKAAQNPELHLMGSDAANTATWVRSRSSAVASSSAAGPGAAEQITYTPTVSGWYGLVVINAAGSGPYTLTRS